MRNFGLWGPSDAALEREWKKERQRIALCLLGPIPVVTLGREQQMQFQRMFRNALDLADLFMETTK